MIDTHCHLTHARFGADRDEVVARARAAGLTACITIGTGTDDARAVHGLMREHEGFVHGTAGLDPFSAHAAGAGFADALAGLDELLRQGGFSAVGEIGLDYHHPLGPPALQAQRFEVQLELAVELGLPVVIHVREAHADMQAVLRAHPRNRGVIHSFTGGPDEAETYLDLGWHLAFNGVLTFPSAEGVREAARRAPAERLLVETDSPYLAPVPERGRRSEPAFVVHTLRRLAELRGEAVESLAASTAANARALFGLGADVPRT